MYRNFDKFIDPFHLETHGYGYNYGSVMQLSEYSFAYNRDCKTIIPIRDTTEILGNKVGVTNLDIGEINELYHCNGKKINVLLVFVSVAVVGRLMLLIFGGGVIYDVYINCNFIVF